MGERGGDEVEVEEEEVDFEGIGINGRICFTQAIDVQFRALLRLGLKDLRI